MTKRELAYLVICLGIGLLFTVAAVIYLAMWFHHMFIVGFAWRPGSVLLALPFLLVFVGLGILIREKIQQNHL